MSKSGVTKWRAAELKETIAKEMLVRMEDAAKVVEVDARSRLMAIKDPEFGRGYRRMLALYRLKSVVRRVGNVIEAQIGIPAGDKGDSYGFYIETGSKSAAAHPWLRPALLNNLATITRLLTGGGGGGGGGSGLTLGGLAGIVRSGFRKGQQAVKAIENPQFSAPTVSDYIEIK